MFTLAKTCSVIFTLLLSEKPFPGTLILSNDMVKNIAAYHLALQTEGYGTFGYLGTKIQITSMLTAGGLPQEVMHSLIGKYDECVSDCRDLLNIFSGE